jgi:hypothetical protein
MTLAQLLGQLRQTSTPLGSGPKDISKGITHRLALEDSLTDFVDARCRIGSRGKRIGPTVERAVASTAWSIGPAGTHSTP